jgi:alanyl-tRNA synthetase
MSDTFPYWTDPMKKEFSVVISTCDPYEGNFATVIQEEVVRAAGGGQAGDRGTLLVGEMKARFIDTVTIKGKLTLIAEEHIPPGSSAVLSIDLKWRGAMMRAHTGEHLFAAAIKKKHDYVELGYIWIEDDCGTVDFEGKYLSFENLIDGESEVQRIIAEALPVKTEFVEASKLSSEIRAREGLSEKHDIMRVVRVGDYDSSACSGIHVTNTRDIGIFKLTELKNTTEGIRVSFLTGDRAIHELSRIYNQVLTRKSEYPFEMKQVGAVLDKAKGLLADKKSLVEKVMDLLTEGPSVEKIGDVRFFHESVPGLDSKAMKNVLKKMTMEGPTAAFLFSPGEKPTFILWQNDLKLEAKDYVHQTVEKLGGRGGGSRDVYTGGFGAVESPEGIYETLVAGIRRMLKQGN